MIPLNVGLFATFVALVTASTVSLETESLSAVSFADTWVVSAGRASPLSVFSFFSEHAARSMAAHKYMYFFIMNDVFLFLIFLSFPTST